MPYLVQRTLMLSKLLLVPLLFVFSQAYAIEEDELLPVEEAYIPTVTVAGDVATLNFIVAPGYYLYKERISLEAARPAEVVMGPLEMPAGEEKTDEFFGKMHVFHKDFTGTSKLTFPAARPVLVAFRLKYQGCADIGVCYPPQTRTFAMDLGGGAAASLTQSENLDAPPPGMVSGIIDPESAVPQMDAAPGPVADPLGLVPSSAGPGLIAQADALPEAQAFRAEALATDGQTVLVYTSDHGENLMEIDGLREHVTNRPTEFELRVPMLFWANQKYRQQHPEKWQQLVNNRRLPSSNREVLPTLLDAMALPPASFSHGESLMRDFVPVERYFIHPDHSLRSEKTLLREP